MRRYCCFLNVIKSNDPVYHPIQPVCSLANWNKWPLSQINLTTTAALPTSGSLPMDHGLVKHWGWQTADGTQTDWALREVGSPPFHSGDLRFEWFLQHTHTYIYTHTRGNNVFIKNTASWTVISIPGFIWQCFNQWIILFKLCFYVAVGIDLRFCVCVCVFVFKSMCVFKFQLNQCNNTSHLI